MTTRRLLFISHVIVASVSAGTMMLVVSATNSFLLSLSSLIALPIALSVGWAWWWSCHMNRGLRMVEEAIASGERPVGESEFHLCAVNVQKHVQRWVELATSGRQEMREVEEVLAFIDRRGTDRNDRRNAGRQLRLLLASLGRETQETLKQLIACNGEFDRVGQRISSVAQQQNESVVKATRDISQLSDDIGAVEVTTSRAQASISKTLDTSVNVSESMLQFREGMDRMREELIAGETKVRLLREHAVEIAALVQAIGEISARTDMLALNASIESVRAGEHGRGFAVVADEIRKLAGQVANSSMEVLDRVATIESEIEETSRILSEERAEIDSESKRVESVGRALATVKDSATQFNDHLQQLGQATQNQLRRAADIVTSLELVLDTSDASRSGAEEARWKTKTLTELIVRLTDILEPLLLAAQRHPTANAAETTEPQTTPSAGTEVSYSVETSPSEAQVPELVGG